MAALVLTGAFFSAVRTGHHPSFEILALHALKASQLIFGIQTVATMPLPAA
jgi:hypothetical protein